MSRNGLWGRHWMQIDTNFNTNFIPEILAKLDRICCPICIFNPNYHPHPLYGIETVLRRSVIGTCRISRYPSFVIVDFCFTYPWIRVGYKFLIPLFLSFSLFVCLWYPIFHTFPHFLSVLLCRKGRPDAVRMQAFRLEGRICESWPSQTNNLSNWYFSPPILVFNITRVGQELVSSVWG